MRKTHGRRSMAALVAVVGIAAAAAADGPQPPPETDVLTRARAVIADVQAFERLNQEIVALCRDPVKGSYADFRDDFREELARTRELERLLGPTPAELSAAAARAAEPTLQPFRAAGDQELYARCLRWGTALIQRESKLRAEIAAKFAFLKSNEAAIRAASTAKDR